MILHLRLFINYVVNVVCERPLYVNMKMVRIVNWHIFLEIGAKVNNFLRCMRNHVKLEICSFVMNFNSKGAVMCGGFWL